MTLFTPLPGRLAWAPRGLGAENARVLQEYKSYHKFPALHFCEYAGGKAGYSIPHYAPEVRGYAFGPLGLDRLMHYCRGLDVQLRHGPVVLVVPPEDKAYRLNALVLLGGYLIMRHAWSVKRLVRAVGMDAKAKFPCSWSRVQTRDKENMLEVKDCWAGIEMAFKNKWLDTDLRDDRALAHFVQTYVSMAHFFDATWIVPGVVMVAADPVTVTTDENPHTCCKLFPDAGENVGVTASTTTPKSRTPELAEAEHGHVGAGTPPGQVDDETPSSSRTSLITVCKHHCPADVCEQGVEDEDVLFATDFATFFVQNNVQLIIRANWDLAEGMHTRSYHDDAFRRYGIQHANMRIVDRGGACPRPQDVFHMLNVCDDHTSSGQAAVLFHCKGGFGRSVVLASCLVIYRLNVPGDAMLGWVRMARPGAITCTDQEVFLKALRGAADVAAYAHMQQAKACCALQ